MNELIMMTTVRLEGLHILVTKIIIKINKKSDDQLVLFIRKNKNNNKKTEFFFSITT